MVNYKEAFDRDGFCIIRNAVSRETVERANLAIDDFRFKHEELLIKHELLANNLLQRVVNFHLSIIPLKDVFFESVESASEITDDFGKATLYTSLFFELGSQQPLHRDTPYFYTGKNRGYMGVWAALDDVDEDNGPLIAVKGSHKLGEANLTELKQRYHPDGVVPESSPELFDAINEQLVDLAEGAGLETHVCRVNRGDVIVWHPETLHGGMRHKAVSKTRRSFVMHITPKNTAVRHMDYFFDRSKKIPEVEKKYEDIQGRLIEQHQVIDFMHKKPFDPKSLGFFG